MKSNRRKHLENVALLICSLSSIILAIMFVVDSEGWSNHEWVLRILVYLICIAVGFALGSRAGRERPSMEHKRLPVEDMLEQRTEGERRFRKLLADYEAATYYDQPSTATGNEAKRSRNRFHGLF